MTTVSAFSQTADSVTKMIESKTVSFEQVAYFAAVSNGLITEDVSVEDAVIALESKIKKSEVKTADALSYEDCAFVCAKAWNIKGGLMFTLFKNPRYAFKEFQAKKYIQESKNPKSKITGRDALYLITKCAEGSI